MRVGYLTETELREAQALAAAKEIELDEAIRQVKERAAARPEGVLTEEDLTRTTENKRENL